jgi:NAD(P)-dependent dehydrogenase (short-subunit alcohol dehydrogenase family)
MSPPFDPDADASPAPVALITGAASGIGAAIARRIGDKALGGLILIDRDEAGLAAAADQVENAPERISTLVFDVTDPDRWAAARGFITEQYGALDWAVANAGIAHAAPIVDMPFDEWRQVMAVNLDATFLTIQTAMQVMRDAGHGGSIVALSSAAGQKAEPGVSAYGASKAGLEQLVRVAAKEGAADGIRVNAIAPGGVETPMWRRVPMFQELVRETGSERAAFDHLAQLATPLGRYATAEDIARLAEMLLLDASPITGAVLVADGGYTL